MSALVLAFGLTGITVAPLADVVYCAFASIAGQPEVAARAARTAAAARAAAYCS